MFGWLRRLFAPRNPYLQLRQMALSAQAKDLGLKPTEKRPAIWGILMEFCVEQATVTLLVMADKTISLYFSNGGGVIGAGEHREVALAGSRLIQIANRLHRGFRPVTDFPLPNSGSVQFYVLTFQGVAGAKARERELEEGHHPLSALFVEGHEVIAAIREQTGG